MYTASALSLLWFILPILLSVAVVVLITRLNHWKNRHEILASLFAATNRRIDEITSQTSNVIAEKENRIIHQTTQLAESDSEFEVFKSKFEALAQRSKEYENRFSEIIDQDSELEKLQKEAELLRSDISDLKISYSEKKETMDGLLEELAVYDERLAFSELGIYEPHFDYNDSEAFKERIRESRQNQKDMITTKGAVICPTEWSVEGSLSKGKTMINRQARLTLRAFNNECEAAIANARWNNVVAMEKRILAAEKAIDKENASMNMVINDQYVALKLEELQLTHEYRERLKVEKEERIELARQEREEKKLKAEAKKAEKEEQKYRDLLEKARREVGADGNATEEMTERIRELEAALQLSHEATERARAMAERTKSGYVYVISNVGSFGENVVKIGLTRRLNPDDRVRELGDASVPFTFDTHAIIYSDQAPDLETALHRRFEDRRINTSNLRKEFFRVTVDEVEKAVTELAPDANFFRDRDAQEWRETMARRNEMLQTETPQKRFPESI